MLKLILLNGVLILYFLYIKLLPHKGMLDAKYINAFSFFERLFNPLLSGLKQIIKPLKVGPALYMDAPQIVLFVLLLILVNII